MDRTLTRQNQPDVYFFASEQYFPSKDNLEGISLELANLLEIDGKPCKFHLLSRQDHVDAVINSSSSTRDLAMFVPFSGQVQPWMLELGVRYRNVAIVNAYLPGFGLTSEASSELLCANAHPAAVDVFARLRRMNTNAFWLSTRDDYNKLMTASAAVNNMKHSRILLIGDTEPWVLNSCVDPNLIRNRFGVEIRQISQDMLAERFEKICENEIFERADEYLTSATENTTIGRNELLKALRLALAVRQLIEEHDADGCALACFALIKKLDTTGCVALSELNDSGKYFGACEGDLDAALTMMLMRNLEAEHFWMGNPIIFPGNEIQLVHCTSAKMRDGVAYDFNLLPHHESGKGVSLDVNLPVGQEVTLARIGNDLGNLLICKGMTKPSEKLRTCRTQSRIEISSSEKFMSSMTGTHVISSHGDYSKVLRYYARLIGLEADVC